MIGQLPVDVELWVVGTPSKCDLGCVEEIESYLASSDKRGQVRLIHDYERIEQYLLAADAAVLFYADGYQSGIVSLAMGAEKPASSPIFPLSRTCARQGRSCARYRSCTRPW